tara:strand:- start:1960 stop:3972 length:2013 start_codon:yes stop_codon:yes gene_type:complete
MADQSKNTKNNESALFKRLTRLFSGPIINYRSQNTRQLRRRRMDKYAFSFKDVAGQKFERYDYNPYNNFSSFAMQTQSRVQRYNDFDQMEFMPEIASALDIYSDEMTTFNVYNTMLNIKSSNEEIKGILEILFNQVLNVNYNLFGWSRTMCKYGDFYLYLDIDEKLGIKQVIGLPTREVERLEGEDKQNPNYVQYQWNSAGITLENWQLAHFRILGNDKFAPYGTSVLDPVRRIWRQLTLLEDAMMAYRIVRSPERKVFYVDVGNIPPSEVEQFMQRFMTSMKRNQVIDPTSGQVDLRYNPMSVEEDYYIPVRGGVQTKIESISGGQYTGDIDDVKYLRDKLFSGLKIPQAYLTYGEGGSEDKGTLAQKDIRFARTIDRLQRCILSELEKIATVHLYVLGFRNEDLLNFKLKLNNPSKIAEMQELEHWKTKFDAVASVPEGYFSKRWVAENIFEISDEEYLRNQRELFYDKQVAAELEGVAAAPDAGMGGGGLGDMGGDMGADMGGDMGGEEDLAVAAGEAGGEEGAPAEEPGGLIAAPTEEAPTPEAPPGNRDDKRKLRWRNVKYVDDKTGETTTTKSKGNVYKPEKVDNRPQGARRRSWRALGSHETARMPKRQVFNDLSLGAKELLGLSKGIFEGKNTNYDEEERKLFETDESVKKLFEDLEQINDE